MYTINYIWIDDNTWIVPEGKSKLYGLFSTIEDAIVGINEMFMKMPCNNIEFKKESDLKYTFLSPNGKSRGSIEVKKIEEF